MFKEIAAEIQAIGMADTNLRKFENQYPLTNGVTYNSYVVSDGGVTAVVDSVDVRCGEQWLEAVDLATNGNVDYLIVQHMEPDHSAMIRKFLEKYTAARLICSAQALKMIRQFFPGIDIAERATTVREGDSLEIGSHTLRFYSAPMVHWPEVTVTYDAKTGVLFSADAFGTFGTNDSFGALWPDEARRYYCNIVGKYGPSVKRVADKLAKLTPLTTIAPLHGPVLKGDDIAEALRLYCHWSNYTPENPDGVLVAYASIYGNTATAALDLAEMLKSKGLETVTIDLCNQDVSEAVAQAFRMGTLVLASATYDAGVFPAMHDFLYHLQIKGLRGRRVALIENGSWAPVAAKVMREMAEQMPDTTVVEPVVTISSALSDESRATLTALADALTAK